MKITYIHQHFSLPSGGGGGRPYEFARRMVADGHKVTMICGGVEPLDEEIDGIRVRRLAVPYRNSMNVPQRIASFARFMISASFAAARTDADIVFASSTPLTVAVPGIIAKLVQRVPMVFEVRDLWPSVPIELGYLKNPVAIWLARSLEKVAYGFADRVVALSPGMRDGVLEVNPKKPVSIIPNASDIELFQHGEAKRNDVRAQLGWRDDETIVVFAGGFGPVYEIEWSVQLAAALKSDNVKFVLIGEGATSKAARDRAIKLGLDPDDLLPGKKPRTEVADYYAGADLILSTMLSTPGLEACSINKIFDGMASGKPILVNHGGWLRDHLAENSAGWRLDQNIGVAAAQVREIISDKDSLIATGANSAALGREKFDRDKLYAQLMDELMEASR